MSTIEGRIVAGLPARTAASAPRAGAMALGGRATASVAVLYAVLVALGMGLLYACGALSLSMPARNPDRDRVYSVVALDAQLARDPLRWADRSVRVRALIEPCPAWGSLHHALVCATLRPDLVDPAGSDLADPLPLATGARSPLVATLGRLPLISRLVPSVPTPRWEVLRTYRVRLHIAAGDRCGTPTCFEAHLLDVTP